MVFSATNRLRYYLRRHACYLVPFLTMYKTYNILLALLEMRLRKSFCTSHPFMFHIDPCSLCNLRCPLCESHNVRTAEKRLMDLADFQHIVDKIHRTAIRASLYGMGEPLLNKDIYSMIKYASDHRLSTLISTNFNLFKPDHLDALFDSQLTILEPCLDGFTQDNYVKYRRGGDVAIVKEGIRLVTDRKQRTKAKWPIVDVQIILFDHIRDELPAIASFLTQCHVDRITYRPETWGFNSPATTMANKSNPSSSTCFWLYLGMTIAPDGNVYPCFCQGNGFPYGNLLKQDLSEIWNNKYYQFSRALFQEGVDLEYSKEMQAVPCIRCTRFRRRRKIGHNIASE